MKMTSCALLLCGALCAGGCGHTAARRAEVQEKLKVHSQALTTAVVEVLELQPATNRNELSELALTLAREDQRIEGLPAEPRRAEELAGKGKAGLAGWFKEIGGLLKEERRLTERLARLGAKQEEETNARRAFWAKWIGGGTVLMGGLIALCVFFPVAIPMLGRVFAWAAGKLPSIAGALGVVSVQAFDAVVRGIERSRAASDSTPLHNQGKGGTEEALETSLAREMDREHKRLVRSRKAALHL